MGAWHSPLDKTVWAQIILQLALIWRSRVCLGIVKSQASAVNSTRIAVERFLRFFRGIVHGLDGRVTRSSTVRGSAVPISLLFLLVSWCDIFPLVVEYVTSNLKVQICFGRGRCRNCAFSRGVGFPRCLEGIWTWLKGLQTSRSVGCDAKMACEWRTDI